MDENKINLWGWKISILDLNKTMEFIRKKIKNKEGGKIYCCTLNELRMAEEDINFDKILRRGDLLTADGMPLVWKIRSKVKKGERVYGPELLENLLKDKKIVHFFVGNKINKKYFEKYGNYWIMPTSDKFSKDDYTKLIAEIDKSKAEIIWISLGSKKQILVTEELYKLRKNKIYITVGAAFDFLSGNKKQAPKWLREKGGEWLFRWICEPKRLTGRYFRVLIFYIKKLFSGN